MSITIFYYLNMAIDIVFFYHETWWFSSSLCGCLPEGTPIFLLVRAFYVGLLDGLLGVAGIIIDSDDWDDSRKFPA